MDDPITNVKFQELLNSFDSECSDNKAKTADEKTRRINAVRSAITSSECRSALFAALQCDGEIDHEAFFSKLECVCRFLGYSDEAHATVGELWLCVLRERSTDEVEANLSAFSRLGHSFRTIASSLETVLSTCPLRVAFANEFLRHLAQRVANDGASFKFWSAARRFVEQQRSIAFELIRSFLKAPDASGLELATFFIGTLRHQDLSEHERCELGSVEDAFSQHSTFECRAAFLRSWVTTAWQSGITEPQLQSLLDRYAIGDEADRQETIAVVSRIASARGVSSEAQNKAIGWLRFNANNAQSSAAKYAIVDFVVHLSELIVPSTESVDADLLCAVLPIPLADTGTWDGIEHYLVKLLEFDVERFHTVFCQIANRDAEGMLEALREPRRFDWLKMEMAKRDVVLPVSRLVLSTVRCERRLGLYLFDELEINGLADVALADAGEIGVQLAFYESQCAMLSGEALAKLFVALLPRVGSMSRDFQQGFFSEVSLQCRNRTGATRAEFQQRAGDHPVVSKILTHTSNQCELLKKASESSIAAMAVPGYDRAGHLFRRRESEAVGRSMEEHSVFLKLCKSVALLYANSNSTYVDGQLAPSSPLTPFSTSIEVPVIDFADPEGMALRRWLAGKAITELQQHVEGEEIL